MAQGSTGGFNVTIRALDEVTSVAERIKRELKSLGEAPQQQVKATNSLFDKLGHGIKEAGRGLTEIGSKARESGEKLHKAFEPIAELSGLGGLAAVASIGGITLALEKYAATGAGLLRTSQAMGINVETLQSFQHGARLAGSDAGALTNGLDVLNQKLRDAAWGRDAGAIAVFKQLNIAVRDSNGEIRKAQDVLPEIAEAVKRNLTDPYIAAEIASKTLGESARVLLPYLRDGAEGLKKFNEDAERYGANIGQDAAKATHEFERAQSELSLAITGVGNSIAKDVLPILEPATLKMAGFVNELRKTPDVMAAIEIGGAALATLFGVTLVASMAKFAISVNAVWASPLFKFLGSPAAAALGIGSALGGLGMGINPIPNKAASPGEAANAWRGNGRGQTFIEWWNGKPAPGAVVAPPGGGMPGAWATAPTGHATTAAPNDARNNWGSLRARGGGWQSFDTPEAGVQAVRNNLLKNYQGLTLRQLISKWAPPGENNTQQLIDRASKMLQMDPDAVPSFSNPEVMRQLVTTMIANEHGGVLPRDLPQGTIDKSLGQGGTAGNAGGGFWHGLGKAFGISGANASPMPGFGVPSPAGTRGAVVDDMMGMLNLSGANPKVRQFIKENGGRIDPLTTAWCAAFIDAAYQHEGLAGQHSDWAMSWKNFGQPVKPGDVQKGDIAVFPQGHVGAFTGGTDPKTGFPQVISGNQGGDHEGGNPGMVGLRGVDPNSVYIRRSAAGDAPPVTLAPNTGGDSSHNVQVTFANAPQGMRTGVQASGSANFTLRTQHALETW